MKNIEVLPELYKRDSNGKIRTWQIQVGYSNDNHAGTRTVSGLKDGKSVTSEWNLSEAKNVGKVNSTNSYTQAQAEAQATWDKRVEKEYFTDISKIDSYDQFDPMLARDYTKTKISEITSDEPVYSQPKLDGIRCIANTNGLFTRSGKPITSCPHIWEAMKPIVEEYPHITFDGELYNHELKEDFNTIVSLVRKTKLTEEAFIESERLVQYHIYDLYNDHERDMSFCLRTAFLLSAIESNNQYLKIVPTVQCNNKDQLDEEYSSYMTDGFEGQMVRYDLKYENKRSKSLLKRKEFITEEFKVLSVVEGMGNWTGYVKRFRIEMPDGTEVGAGVRGTQAQLKELFESGETPDWATLRYFGLTPDGVPRFPVVIDYGKGERTD